MKCSLPLTETELLQEATYKLQDTLEAIREGTWQCPDEQWLLDLSILMNRLQRHWSEEDMRRNG